jgi:hypothetical protein
VSTSDIIAALISSSIILSGCSSDSVKKSEVLGVYVSNRADAVDIVNLMPDGRYAHYYVDPNGSRVQDLGAWTYDSSDGNTRVTLQDWFESFEGSSGKLKSVTMCFSVDRSGGLARLIANDDLGEYYFQRSAHWKTAEHIFDSLGDIFFGTHMVH